MSERFSDRHGFGGDMTEIMILQDFPIEHRSAIIRIAEQSDVDIFSVREAMVQVLVTGVNTSDWSPDFARASMINALHKCDWWDVYDIAEEVYKIIDDHMQKKYTDLLNRFFVRQRFGWEMRNGFIEYRGTEPFMIATESAEQIFQTRGFDVAASETREAMRALSRRPEPNLTGAVTHAIRALEAVAREELESDKRTLGELIPSLDLPKPLDGALSNLWGFSSQYARHGSEEKQIDDDEAELVVTVACAIATFIAKRQLLVEAFPWPAEDDDLPFE